MRFGTCIDCNWYKWTPDGERCPSCLAAEHGTGKFVCSDCGHVQSATTWFRIGECDECRCPQADQIEDLLT